MTVSILWGLVKWTTTSATGAAVATAEDPRFKEWSECRQTIGRLDGILVDLRKVGFSFVTALISAGSFVSVLGFVQSNTYLASPAVARGAIFVAIMLLIAALFFLDSYYEVLLSGAVERALDIETQTEPPVRITKYLSINALNSHATQFIVVLYVVLLVVACVLGVLAVLGNTVIGGNPAVASFTIEPWSPAASAVTGIGALLLALILLYWKYVASAAGLYTHKERTWKPGEDARDKKAAP